MRFFFFSFSLSFSFFKAHVPPWPSGRGISAGGWNHFQTLSAPYLISALVSSAQGPAFYVHHLLQGSLEMEMGAPLSFCAGMTRLIWRPSDGKILFTLLYQVKQERTTTCGRKNTNSRKNRHPMGEIPEGKVFPHQLQPIVSAGRLSGEAAPAGKTHSRNNPACKGRILWKVL